MTKYEPVKRFQSARKQQAQHDILKRKGRARWREFKQAYPQLAREQIQMWRHFKSI